MGDFDHKKAYLYKICYLKYFFQNFMILSFLDYNLEGKNMKLITKTLIFVGLSTLAFSQETMCFKKNHTNLETIETVKLDGGLCVGQNSKIDMQKKGWYVKNIEMKNDYYVYIFKKLEEKQVEVQEAKEKILLTNENISKEKLKQEIISEIKVEKAKEIKKQKAVAKVNEYEKGKNFYINKCSSCHGINGEKEAGYSKALNSISKDDFKFAINGYRIGSYDLGNSSEMKPYSIGITTSDVNAIFNYLGIKK